MLFLMCRSVLLCVVLCSAVPVFAFFSSVFSFSSGAAVAGIWQCPCDGGVVALRVAFVPCVGLVLLLLVLL
jgi:hypothetical protein